MSGIHGEPFSRKTFLQVAAAAGLAAGALAAAPRWATPAAKAATPKAGMNILFVMVDQMRTPWVYMPPAMQRFVVPTITKLGNEGVRFSNYFTVSNDCTPARAAQISGLYTHQMGVFGTTGTAELNPGFPTFGTMLREQGYDTYWFGKWHITPSDLTGAGTVNGCMPNPYEAYGFTTPDPTTGTCPSPDGGAGQGQFIDPITRQQFRDWLATRPTDGKPWLTTLSLINPHDIQFYPYYTRRIHGQQFPRPIYRKMPNNYETNDERKAKKKPTLQLGSISVHNDTFGDMPDEHRVPKPWVKMLNTYALVQSEVDLQIYSALRALDSSPFADNTIVIFASDHGEYAGAHGMRGKGFSFYDEGSRVPLIVKDPSNTWISNAKIDRHQLFSSLDLSALMLTMAPGNEDWRGDSRYAQIANRASIAAVLKSPTAKGRRYIAHATDEEAIVPAQLGGGDEQTPYPAPNHITAVRTKVGKIARYAYWKDGGYEIDESRPIEWEAYDYSTERGRLELDNVYSQPASKAFVRRMKVLLDVAMVREIQAPVPAALKPAQTAAFKKWFGDSTTDPPTPPTRPDSFRETMT